MNIFSTSFDYPSRLSKVRGLMKERSIDAVLVHLWVNQYYITGAHQHVPWYPVEVIKHTEAPLIIFADEKKEPIFCSTFLCGVGIKEGSVYEDVRFLDRQPYGKKEWFEYVADFLKQRGVDKGVIGYEDNVMVTSTFRKLQSVLPKAQFKPAEDIFAKARLIKEPEEIELIRQSVKAAEAALQAGMNMAKVGVVETEVQKVIEIELKKQGALREIETMFQSGRRTATHRFFAANWKKIERNDLGNIDIGCIYKGYGCDICRTWCIGKPTESQKKVMSDILNTREKIVQLMKPGVLLGKLHAAGAESMKNAGYIVDTDYLPDNKIGWGYVAIHGIGLGPMHDPPFVFERDLKLEPGMTLSLTSGVRFADSTIRCEDNFLLIPGGAELLSKLIPWKL